MAHYSPYGTVASYSVAPSYSAATYTYGAAPVAYAPAPVSIPVQAAPVQTVQVPLQTSPVQVAPISTAPVSAAPAQTEAPPLPDRMLVLNSMHAVLFSTTYKKYELVFKNNSGAVIGSVPFNEEGPGGFQTYGNWERNFLDQSFRLGSAEAITVEVVHHHVVVANDVIGSQTVDLSRIGTGPQTVSVPCTKGRKVDLTFTVTPMETQSPAATFGKLPESHYFVQPTYSAVQYPTSYVTGPTFATPITAPMASPYAQFAAPLGAPVATNVAYGARYI
eukprot:TRINITY_DN9135_c0_g1_i1.p1 TRINITY_DN9135_c0_g1~~TRINITY_DN9135_c0_g1_i1.p1  ORF type:complete len:276 (+),score=56.76 TRINITY_DN9135_c0_g1_i1:59-886(+)